MVNNLFWSLKPADKAKLIMYQWKTYGYKLEIPSPAGVTITDWREALEENRDEIDKIMRQKPHSLEKVK